MESETFWTGSRFRVYVRTDDGIQCVAEADTATGLGTALVTMADDNRLAGLPVECYGVLDAHARRWISGLWTTANETPFH
jgi:hypothetical protein